MTEISTLVSTKLGHFKQTPKKISRIIMRPRLIEIAISYKNFVEFVFIEILKVKIISLLYLLSLNYKLKL